MMMGSIGTPPFTLSLAMGSLHGDPRNKGHSLWCSLFLFHCLSPKSSCLTGFQSLLDAFQCSPQSLTSKCSCSSLLWFFLVEEEASANYLYSATLESPLQIFLIYNTVKSNIRNNFLKVSYYT
jgi:hypothetical protein